METPFVKVLLLGENATGSAYLRWQLENRGCHCWFAHSAPEAASTFREHTFDLILSTTPRHQHDPALTLLRGNTGRIYHCQPDEDSCWWLPLAADGQRSDGPGMRPSEFFEMLDKMLAQRRAKNFPPQTQLPAVQRHEQALKAAS